ncbi:broad substrate specificity ATP-binding cassette transporter ABCG2-like [Etheostoma cragini]|uniref:broad substrate specificity ATP-binding cassette transporter ABCG2-like n=1 Tax=Etheostoma cragini TaxID=417921 RepID=UPI00155EDE45|nr:broad substrate specificity ATP-binding cassette transporter ABCG2-like [Etheostoma cragini]
MLRPKVGSLAIVEKSAKKDCSSRCSSVGVQLVPLVRRGNETSFGIMKPGLNAIMGATGSGKSSFLDVLAARKDPAGLTGEVLIDGAPQPPNFKCLSGYVVQDDVVMGTLTVRENLTFSAALRLPAAISQGEKKRKVDKLIQELGLGRVADSRVRRQEGVGGCKGVRDNKTIIIIIITIKRVLPHSPSLSPLHVYRLSCCCPFLFRMANNGRTIILSIHQPRYSIYRLFDSLTLLVTGKMVYHGPAQTALDYFSDIGYTCEPHNNPADFFLDIINGDSTAVALNSTDKEDPDSDLVSKSKRGIEDKLVEDYKSSQHFRQTRAELGHHHEDAGDGHVDVGDGDHRLVGGDGERHGGGGVGDHDDAEHEDEEGRGRRLEACTGNISGPPQAVQINEFTGLNFCRGFNSSVTPPGLACTGEEFLEIQGVDPSTWGLWQNHLALGVMTLCFLIIAYLKLRFIRKFT